MPIRNTNDINRLVSQVTGRELPEDWGEIGIEIECEGQNLCHEMYRHWKVAPDGSLRNNGVEYILRKPILREDVPLVLRYLNKKLLEQESVVEMGPRTSVHIHLNALDMPIQQVYTWICLYLVV